MSVPFLLEIGTEEIPDWMIEPALADLKQRFETLLAASQLADGASVRADATPRRLVLRADAIAERQPDTEELVSGPPKAAAFKDGQPTGAAIGFAFDGDGDRVIAIDGSGEIRDGDELLTLVALDLGKRDGLGGDPKQAQMARHVRRAHQAQGRQQARNKHPVGPFGPQAQIRHPVGGAGEEQE